MKKQCEHCQQPMLRCWCDDCDGNGGWWSRVVYFDEHGDDHRWQECQWCAGTGHRWHCTNRDCPGVVWYPLSREDDAIMRMVIASVEREEKR